MMQTGEGACDVVATTLFAAQNLHGHVLGFLRKLSRILARTLKNVCQICHRPKEFKEY
jgi:hypothetical protein